MRFLLDANAVIALLNDTTSPIALRLRRLAPRGIAPAKPRARRRTR